MLISFFESLPAVITYILSNPTTCGILLLVFVFLAVLLKGFPNVLYSLRRRFNVVSTQKGNSFRAISAHVLLVFALMLFGYCIVRFWGKSGNLFKDLLNVSYDNDSSDSVIHVTTMSATLFSTLTTVILALIALAVTAHVFLNDALLNRKDYESAQIKNLKKHSTSRMFTICIVSGLCITLCLIIDNVDNISSDSDQRLTILRYVAVLASFLDILGLVLFINSIVNYEKHLLEYAKSYVIFNQSDLIKKKRKPKITKRIKYLVQGIKNIGRKKVNRQLFARTRYHRSIAANDKENIRLRTIKGIGDLENLVRSIINNHESEFRYQNGMTSDTILSGVLNVKSQKIIYNNVHSYKMDLIKKGTLPEIQISTAVSKYERIVRMLSDTKMKTINDRYLRLIEIRNCLWMIHDNGDSIAIDSDIEGCVSKIMRDIMRFALRDERFVDLNFNDVDFSEGDFSNSSLKSSAILNSRFQRAILENCDFSECLLQNVDFSDANCSNAVFSGARIISPIVNQKTNFEKSVFNDCEITITDGETIGGHLESYNNDATINNYPFQFQRISCQRANFVKCKFYGINFENSVFKDATFYDAQVINCNFDRANMENANISNADIYRLCSFQYANCSGISAVYSNWGVNEFSENDAWLDLTGSRFVHANMAFAKLSCCRFLRAYLNDATFTAADMEKCHFNGSLLTNVDFTDADIINSNFSHTVLTNALFIGNSQSAEIDRTIRKTDFISSEMNGCSIKNYTFDGCQFKEAVLDDSVIRDVTFRDCDFDFARFCGVLLFNVSFINCEGKILRSAMSKISFGTQDDKSRFESAFTIIDD